MLDALDDITCARARQVVEAYAERYEDCSLRQLTSGDCTVPDGAEADYDERVRKSPLGTWKVKLARGSENAAWTGAAA